MMRPPFFIGLSLSVYAILVPAHSKPGPQSVRKSNLLDTLAIHRTYLEGDFEEAIDKIETARRYGGPFSHEDSIFIFKHLGVMYTAKYESREKGKRHLMQLLYVEPTARILDMYASDMIYMIFKNIKDEFDLSQAKLDNANRQLTGGEDGDKAAGETHRKEPKSKQGGSKAWIGWTAGALAAAGGVAILIHMQEEETKSSPKEITLQ